ncbi:MAG: hypothetical protein HKN16_12975, partial [Saprospiraceae bacterium]|nr:hypothetical protein [Saprospiraceae bacterium]
MNSLLKYLILALFVVLISAWFISQYKTWTNENQNMLSEEISSVEDPSSSDEIAEPQSEEFAEYDEELDALDAEIAALEEELGALEKGESVSNQPLEKNIAIAEPKPKSVVNRPSSPLPRTNTSPAGPEFMVIAGSYSSHANADAMEKNLNDLGHMDVEVVQFDLSKLHTVCAGRFNNPDNAQRLTESLRAAGIQAYVHK